MVGLETRVAFWKEGVWLEWRSLTQPATTMVTYAWAWIVHVPSQEWTTVRKLCSPSSVRFRTRLERKGRKGTDSPVSERDWDPCPKYQVSTEGVRRVEIK